jgi:hypothetical protein
MRFHIDGPVQKSHKAVRRFSSLALRMLAVQKSPMNVEQALPADSRGLKNET